MNDKAFEALLYEDESTTLDFKREQYRFGGEDDDLKSELLKDILAFANAWRRSDAYILIGVEEIKGDRSRVWGVQAHLNDSELQQFVNSKTQRPIEFSYNAFKFESKQIGIIHVPVQERPSFLRRNYGRLRREIVYIRRGSGTTKADPDEIARFGASSLLGSEAPQLTLEFAAPEERSILGDIVKIRSVLLTMPPTDEIPTFRTRSSSFLTVPGENLSYYKELAVYLQHSVRVEPIRFALRNIGNTTARDVRAELFVTEPTSHLYVVDEYDTPIKPARNTLLAHHQMERAVLSSNVTAERVQEGWRILATFGKCQPKQLSIAEGKIYLGASASGDIKMRAQIFSDELPDPLELNLTVQVTTEQRALSVEELISL